MPLEHLASPPATSAPGLTRLLIAEAPEALGPELRRIIQLRADGYTAPEIAARLVRSLEAVQRGLTRAWAALRILYADELRVSLANKWAIAVWEAPVYQ